MIHMQSRRASPETEIAALDGVRALAILLVLWCHLTAFGIQAGREVGPAWLAVVAGFGFVGVLLFFNLSGFLLFLPYARALLVGTPWPSMRNFYLRRVVRILPAYVTCLGVLVALRASFLFALPQFGHLALLLGLLFDLRPETAHLADALDSPWWTLAIEWQFYLLLPWVALGLRWVAGRATGHRFFRRVSLALVLLIVLGLAIRGWVAWVHYGLGYAEPLSAPGLLGVSVEFLSGRKGKYWEVFALGMSASLLYVWALEKRALRTPVFQRLGWVGLLLAVVGLSGCCVWAASIGRIPTPQGEAWIYPPQAPGWAILGDWLVGVCFLLVLIASLILPPLQRAFGSLMLRFLGKISYSLYLWHVPLLVTLLLVPASFPQWVLESVLLILPFGTLSYLLTEKPFLRWRRNLRQSRPSWRPAKAWAREAGDRIGEGRHQGEGELAKKRGGES